MKRVVLDIEDNLHTIMSVRAEQNGEKIPHMLKRLLYGVFNYIPMKPIRVRQNLDERFKSEPWYIEYKMLSTIKKTKSLNTDQTLRHMELQKKLARIMNAEYQKTYTKKKKKVIESNKDIV